MWSTFLRQPGDAESGVPSCMRTYPAAISAMQVELANMNRLFFRPEHCGMTKTDAAAVTLSAINPDVALEPFTMNITTLKGFDAFKASLVDSDTGKSRVDLVLACVDNYEARITINQAGDMLALDHLMQCGLAVLTDPAAAGLSAAAGFIRAVCATLQSQLQA